ncbi:hypothetical protein [Synechococcus sp. BA-132 BA5]|uniref:hypothetical protein n=1 Tax=Synechococcus sp. BA-132 BA5 TaxID=3110252 RepID=UPI002B1FDDAC|nr:hypothetical protein [Synechococcus sp. BA-132 BA5]MEA5414268.1 hypothetical protein [Synechococcus sp. BA-132 BA5]
MVAGDFGGTHPEPAWLQRLEPSATNHQDRKALASLLPTLKDQASRPMNPSINQALRLITLWIAWLPAVYTAVLSQQNLAAAAHYGYLGLYIGGYIADDALMVGFAVLALSSSKLTEGTGRWLKLISGVVMVALGLLLVLRPSWLF